MRLSRLVLPGRPPTRTDPPGLLQSLAQPGIHETRLAERFGGRMRFEGAAPEFDRPLVVVAFTNRSGSNLLCDYLLQARRVGGAGEFLNHDIAARHAEARGIGSLPDYVRHLVGWLAAGGRRLALKASSDQFAMLARHRITAMFPAVIVLHSLRSDTLAQAVSYAIALRSGQWTSSQPAREIDPAAIDLAEIARHMADVQAANLAIRILCDALSLPRHEVPYETVAAGDTAPLGRILAAAGLADPGWTPGQPALARQAGPANRLLTERFLAAARQALSGGPGAGQA